MATYSAITSVEIDAESPITVELAGKWTNNHLAIAEGDATAPAVDLDLALQTSETDTGKCLTPDGTSGSKGNTQWQSFVPVVRGTIPDTDGDPIIPDVLVAVGGNMYRISYCIKSSAGGVDVTTPLYGTAVVFYDGTSSAWVVHEVYAKHGTGLADTSITVNGSNQIQVQSDADTGDLYYYVLEKLVENAS